MTYEESLAHIHSLLRFGSRPGLRRIRRLLTLLGDPQEGVDVIHIAGTNGKGSTTTMISRMLQEAGQRVGTFISPYIVDFRERIQIDGSYIPKEEVARLNGRLLDVAKEMDEELTEFEWITAMAFLYFKEQACDVVVLETGMGGRFDATNVVEHPKVSVITSISMDHEQVLGDTIAKIAFEKAGIIKPGVPVVSAPRQDPEALAVLLEQVAHKQTTLILPNLAGVEILSEDLDGTRIRVEEREMTIPLAGEHQILNALTAIQAVRCYRPSIPDEVLARGMEQVRFPARLERLSERPLVVLDGAHNKAGAESFAGAVKLLLKGKELCGVFGILADKDVESFARIIAPLCQTIWTVGPDNPRAMDPEALAAIMRPYCPDSRAAASADEVLSTHPDRRAIIICGALFLAPRVRRFFKNSKK